MHLTNPYYDEYVDYSGYPEKPRQKPNDSQRRAQVQNPAYDQSTSGRIAAYISRLFAVQQELDDGAFWKANTIFNVEWSTEWSYNGGKNTRTERFGTVRIILINDVPYITDFRFTHRLDGNRIPAFLFDTCKSNMVTNVRLYKHRGFDNSKLMAFLKAGFVRDNEDDDFIYLSIDASLFAEKDPTVPPTSLPSKDDEDDTTLGNESDTEDYGDDDTSFDSNGDDDDSDDIDESDELG